MAHAKQQLVQAEPLADEIPRNAWDKPKQRKCLVCRDEFESAWSGERICKRCKSSNGWKSGALDI